MAPSSLSHLYNFLFMQATIQIDKIVKWVWHRIHLFPVSKLNVLPETFDFNGDSSRWLIYDLWKLCKKRKKRKKEEEEELERNLNAIDKAGCDEKERNLAAALDFDYPLVKLVHLALFLLLRATPRVGTRSWNAYSSCRIFQRSKSKQERESPQSVPIQISSSRRRPSCFSILLISKRFDP